MSKDKRLQIVGGDKPPGDEELRRWLAEHTEQHPHLTTVVLSRKDYIGMSRTALDAYIAGTYFLSQDMGGAGVDPHGSSQLEPKVRAYRERIEGTERHGYTNTFLETRSWMMLQQACATAINESVIVVVYGKPGVGKSRCLREYAVKRMTTPVIEVFCSANVTTRYFVQKLAQAVGLDDSPTTPRLEDMIAEKLKRNARPIFVDQANYLAEKALGTICHLWEKARVPVVLVGTHDLYNLFTTSRMTEDVRAQLSSRVAMHYPLVELGLPEVKTIVERALGAAATPQVIAQVLNMTGGIHRHIDMVLPRIIDMQTRSKTKLESGQLTMEQVVAHAGSRLMTG